MKTVYLGLGSNVGEREANLQAAVDALHGRDLAVTRLSSVYETEPQDFRAQRWFLNLVAEVSTDLFPRQLLTRLAQIEQKLGRRRLVAKGPRTIDIDILLFGGFIIETPELVVPHPRLRDRRFVLAPLAELAPDLRDPVTHRSMRELHGKVADQKLAKQDFRPVIPGA
jgi:2-amino-4-hydroxy-6-hydroxymethyldihydropteridine diphosphokinase